MTKKEIAQAEAVKTLKDWGVVDNTTVYAKVTRVSASGMNRRVQLFIILTKIYSDDLKKDLPVRTPEIINISYHAAKALGWSYKDGYNGGISVSGCGMDMMFHTVGSLSLDMGYGPLSQSGQKTGLIYKSI